MTVRQWADLWPQCLSVDLHGGAASIVNRLRLVRPVATWAAIVAMGSGVTGCHAVNGRSSAPQPAPIVVGQKKAQMTPTERMKLDQTVEQLVGSISVAKPASVSGTNKPIRTEGIQQVAATKIRPMTHLPTTPAPVVPPTVSVPGRLMAQPVQQNGQTPSASTAGPSAELPSVPVDELVHGSPMMMPGPAPGAVMVGEPIELGAPLADIASDDAEAILLPAPQVGVPGDGPGLADNLSVRGGVSSLHSEESNGFGGTLILEYSNQIKDKPWFWHSGVAATLMNDDIPLSFTAGFSRLATIEDGVVTKPGIFSVAYDGYADSHFRGRPYQAYLDQLRILGGWAVSPRTDVGVWSAIGLNTSNAVVENSGGSTAYQTALGDRVAGYIAKDFGARGSRLMLSAGWEEAPGTMFITGDIIRPIGKRTNLWLNAGYSDSGWFSTFAGLEFMLGRPGGKQGRLARPVDVCGDPCGDVCGDPCADHCRTPARYRGGWAYGNHRGALRVLTPVELQRSLDETSQFTPQPAIRDEPPVVPPIVLPPVVDPPKPKPDDVDPCPPPPECLPRRTDRPVRESRLSQRLAGLAPLTMDK